MACGGCAAKHKQQTKDYKYSVMGGYGYLSQQQIQKRLEVFKRIYCIDCENRYKCDYENYLKCDKVEKNGG